MSYIQFVSAIQFFFAQAGVYVEDTSLYPSPFTTRRPKRNGIVIGISPRDVPENCEDFFRLRPTLDV